jgi:SWI/SNF-related matrix-associated actin-dependent regulator of chromatin subfamily A member 5
MLTHKQEMPGQTQESKRAERRKQKQKRKADETELHKRREEMDKAKVGLFHRY